MQRKYFLIFTICLAAFLFFSFLIGAGCARQEPPGEKKDIPKYTPTPSIGLVVPSPASNGKWFLKGVEEGLKKAESQLAMDVNRLEPGELPEDEDRLRYLADNGNKLIFFLGGNLGTRLEAVASDYPELKFALLGGEAEGENIITVREKYEEAAFIAGIVAAHTTKNNYVAFLGGKEDPFHREEENSFKKGVNYALKGLEKKVKVEVKYVGPGILATKSPAKAQEIAATLYERGADFIYETAGGSGAGVWKAAAEKKKVFFSSKPVPAEYRGYSSGDTLFKTAEVVFTLAKELASGKLKAGTRLFGIKENVMAITLGPAIPQEARDAAVKAIQEIKKGKIKI